MVTTCPLSAARPRQIHGYRGCGSAQSAGATSRKGRPAKGPPSANVSAVAYAGRHTSRQSAASMQPRGSSRSAALHLSRVQPLVCLRRASDAPRRSCYFQRQGATAPSCARCVEEGALEAETVQWGQHVSTLHAAGSVLGSRVLIRTRLHVAGAEQGSGILGILSLNRPCDIHSPTKFRLARVCESGPHGAAVYASMLRG